MEGLGRSLKIRELEKLQEELSRKVLIEPLEEEPQVVGGVDASYRGRWGVGVLILMRWPELEVIEERFRIEEVDFPYLPGFLSFREVPLLEPLFEDLDFLPQVLFVDGQGIAHPRRLGLASHLGVILGIRTIGCAKRPLIGKAKEPEDKEGAFSLLRHEGEVVGVLLRTKKGVKPLCVSPGHRMDLEGSIRLVLKATRGFRIPEPLRRAHLLSRRLSSGLVAE